mmetsp:Transcript_72975/g.65651  ORF Transcript_72975/g.65651 Transcript_72975/m.65651 type:complete len:494 (-) Transcript_72975:408-1889(-)
MGNTGPVYSVEQCPAGTEPWPSSNAALGSFIAGSPEYNRYGSKMTPGIRNIAECKAKCDEDGADCRVFMYGSFIPHGSTRICRTWQQVIPVRTYPPIRYNGQYMRRPLRLCRKISIPQVASHVVANVPQTPPEQYRCPQGTRQYGSAGQFGAPSTPLQEITDQLDNIEECEKRCCDAAGCVAFIFDDVPDICILLKSRGEAVTRNYGSTDEYGNSVMCLLNYEGGLCPAEEGCPSGTNQIGSVGQQYSGDRQLVGTFVYKTIEECADQCRCNEDCFVFTFDNNVNGKSLCKLWQSGQIVGNYQSSSQYAQEIICAVEVCPDGTSQIGGAGTRLRDLIGGVRGIAGPDSCKEKCEAQDGCKAFTFDFDTRTYHLRDRDGGDNTEDSTADNGCLLYSSDRQYGFHSSRGAMRDGVSCELDASGSSAQSGYLNFEAITNEAGQGSSDMSVYIIYAVMALILVNIICLIINCWNKKRGNSKRYKVVSMRSDEEITDA